MAGIPVSFEHKGKKFKGYFSEVKGAAVPNAWHLYDNQNFYKGQITINARNEFVFTDQKMDLGYLSGYFQEIILAWYE